MDAQVDTIFTDGKIIIDLEINTRNGERLQKKNQHYQFELAVGQVRTHNDYLKRKSVIQINIDYFDFYSANRFLYVSKFMETTLHMLDNDAITCYRVNVSKLQKEEYNLVKAKYKRLAYLLYFFVCEDENKLNKLYEGDKLMEEVVKLGKQISDDRFDSLYMTEEELNQIYKEDYADNQYKQGKIDMIKALLNEKIPDEIIIKTSDISKKELEKIKNSL